VFDFFFFFFHEFVPKMSKVTALGLPKTNK